MKLVIKNGRVMDPASGRDEVTNIWVEDEKIIGFVEHPEWAEEAEELNWRIYDCCLHGKYKTNCRHTRSPSGYFRAYKEPSNPCKTGLSGFKKF